MDIKKSNNYSSITILLLVVVVLVMSVGYANFTQSLKINGKTTVSSATWNIKLLEETYSENEDGVSVEPENLILSGTSMSYKIKLEKPGDFYEFTIYAKNAGTFDAVLTGITLSGLSETQKKYMTYELVYNETSTYKTTTDNLSIEMKSGATVPVKVLVRYFQPDAASDLPSEQQEIDLVATLNYQQKTN